MHLLFFAGRKGALWLCVWYQCPWLCRNVHSAKLNECIHNIIRMRGQCFRLLPAAHGGSLCLCCFLFPTVSTQTYSSRIFLYINIYTMYTHVVNIIQYIQQDTFLVCSLQFFICFLPPNQSCNLLKQTSERNYIEHIHL